MTVNGIRVSVERIDYGDGDLARGDARLWMQGAGRTIGANSRTSF
jgi:hypothetical protein